MDLTPRNATRSFSAYVAALVLVALGAIALGWWLGGWWGVLIGAALGIATLAGGLVAGTMLYAMSQDGN